MSNKKRARVLGMGKDIFKDDELEQDHPIDGFVADETRVVDLNLDQIFPNPQQPRKFFSEESLGELSESIKQHGILQPIIVKKADNGFTIVAGERRFRAAKLAGLRKIPALIKSNNTLEISIIENIQREDLKPIEEAEGLQMLVDHFEYTHEDLAKVIGKSRSSITEVLSLNKLPEQIKEECRASDNHSKSILLQVVRQEDEERMLALWEQIKNGKLTVRGVRKRIKNGSRSRPFEYKFISPERDFFLTIRFRKSEVDEEAMRIAFEKAFKNFLEKYPKILAE